MNIRNRRKIKEITKATIRCIPLDQKKNHPGVYFFWNGISTGRVLFASITKKSKKN
jgi:prolyl-tRNA synthetase